MEDIIAFLVNSEVEYRNTAKPLLNGFQVFTSGPFDQVAVYQNQVGVFRSRGAHRFLYRARRLTAFKPRLAITPELLRTTNTLLRLDNANTTRASAGGT